MECVNEPFNLRALREYTRSLNQPRDSDSLRRFGIQNTGTLEHGNADEAKLLDLTTREQRPDVCGMFYWLHNLKLAIGASFGAFLFEDHRFLLFTITGGALLIALVTTILWIQETYRPATAHQNDSHGGDKLTIVRVYRTVFTDHTFMTYLVERRTPTIYTILIEDDILIL